MRHKDDDTTNPASTNLEWGTAVDNQMDCIRRGRNARVERTHCLKGHEYSESNTAVYTRPSGRTYRQCRTCKRGWGRRDAQRLAARRALNDD